MTEQAHVMNSPSAIDRMVPNSLLGILTAYLADQILRMNMGFGLRAIAADNNDAALTAKRRAVMSNSVALASGRMEGVARSRLTGANDLHVRFQQEIVPHLDAAYNFARFLSRNPDAAQDIVQEAFLRAYRGFDGYQGGDARAWIFTIVRNCYYNWLIDRRRKARMEIDVHRSDDSGEFSIDDVPSEEDTPDMALLRSSEASTVRLVLNKLPRSLREVLVLRELEGLSYRQIAETVAMPIGTVMSRLARARTLFESAWRQEASFQEKQT
jgi:RNA polymerase sigma factor (sigma-70 family)